MADVTCWPGEQNYSCASRVTMNKKIFPIPYCVQQTLGDCTALFLSYCGGSFSDSAKGGGGPLWRKQWYLFTQHGNLPFKSILDSSGLEQNWHTPFISGTVNQDQHVWLGMLPTRDVNGYIQPFSHCLKFIYMGVVYCVCILSLWKWSTLRKCRKWYLTRIRKVSSYVIIIL